MKFVAYLCLTISATHFSVDGNPPQRTKAIQKRFNVQVEDIEIPGNSWWKGIETPKQSWLKRIEMVGESLWQRISTGHNNPIRNSLPFEKIEYNQTIRRDSPIRIDYTVQYAKDQNEWINMTNGFVYLCDPNAPDTEPTSIQSLVREILGIREGCPVLAGERKNTSDIHLPLVGRTLFFDGGRIEPKMRILITTWESITIGAEKLLSAKFYLETIKNDV